MNEVNSEYAKFCAFDYFFYLSPVQILIFMSNKAKFIVFLVALVAIFAACSLTIQVQRDNTNSTQTNSQETNQSADSTRVNLHLNP